MRIDQTSSLDDDALDANTKAVTALEPHELMQTLAADAEGEIVYAATTFGRLLALDVATGHLAAERMISPALGTLAVAVVPGGDGNDRVVTYGADGMVREFDAELEPVQATPVPGTGRLLELAPDGSSLLAGTTEGTLVLIDPDSLRVIQHVIDDRANTGGYHFSPSGDLVVGTSLRRTGDTDEPDSFDDQLEVIRITD